MTATTAAPFALAEALLDVSPARFADPVHPVEAIARREQPQPADEKDRRVRFDELLLELALQSRLDVHFGILARQADALADLADSRDAGPAGPVGCPGWASEGERHRHHAQSQRLAQVDARRRTHAAAADLRRLAGVA